MISAQIATKKEGIEKRARITTTEMIVLKSTRTLEERIQLAIGTTVMATQPKFGYHQGWQRFSL